MEITYIGHSGFLVELERHVLLFDYFQGEIPEGSGRDFSGKDFSEKDFSGKDFSEKNYSEKDFSEKDFSRKGFQEKQWLVFASHRHQDHFRPEIFKLAETHPRLQYVFSADIWRSRIPEERLAQTVRLKAGEHWQNEDGDIQVETLRSTDEGVAFLVRAEGKVIYHAGDLNNWYWELESEDWNRKMDKNYRKFIEPLRGREIDAAFVVLDPRQGDAYALGMDYFLELTRAKKVYPMHCWEEYSIIERWKKEHPDSPYRESVVNIDKRGARFLQ